MTPTPCLTGHAVSQAARRTACGPARGARRMARGSVRAPLGPNGRPSRGIQRNKGLGADHAAQGKSGDVRLHLGVSILALAAPICNGNASAPASASVKYLPRRLHARGSAPVHASAPPTRHIAVSSHPAGEDRLPLCAASSRIYPLAASAALLRGSSHCRLSRSLRSAPLVRIQVVAVAQE
jgi:hypothetical protein